MRPKATATKRKVVPGYDFSYLYPKYRGKWVALTRDGKRVIEVSSNAGTLFKKIGKRNLAVYRVPSTDALFIGGV